MGLGTIIIITIIIIIITIITIIPIITIISDCRFAGALKNPAAKSEFAEACKGLLRYLRGFPKP